MLSYYIILVLLGIIASAQEWDCIPATLTCTRFRAVINTHRDLITSVSDFDHMCRQQKVFYRCLEDAISSAKTKTEKLPAAVEQAKIITDDLCSLGLWQQNYIGVAPCINRQFTEFCTSPEFLAEIKLENKSRTECSLREEAVKCISATLVMNCGSVAGDIFDILLEMNNDGRKNCYSVGPELLYPPYFPKAKDSEKDVYKDVYDNLLKRIGTIPEQDETDVSTIADEVQSEAKFKPIAEDHTREDLVSELPQRINNRFYDLDALDSLNLQRRSSVIDADGHETQYIGPRLTFRYYNNGTTYAYAQIPFFENVEIITCMHRNDKGKHEFVCTELYRRSEPSCMEGERTEGLRNTRIIPEEIDPEFGAKVYDMDQCSYQFRPMEEICSDAPPKSVPPESTERHKAGETNPIENLKEAIRNFYSFYTKSESEPISDSEIIDIKYLKTGHEANEKVDGSFEEQSEGFVAPLSFIKRSIDGITSISEVDPEIREEILKVLKSAGISLSPRALEIAGIISREARSLAEDFSSVKESPTSNGLGVQYSWPGREDSRLESLHCSRVNECHPKATAVVKCTFKLKGVGGSWTTGCPATAEGKDSAFSFNFGPVRSRKAKLPPIYVYSEEPATMFVPGETSKLHSSLPITESELYFAETNVRGEDLAEEAQFHTNLESEGSASAEDVQLVFESDVLYPVSDLESEENMELVRINSVEDEYKEDSSSEISSAEESDDGEIPLSLLEGIIRKNIDDIAVE